MGTVGTTMYVQPDVSATGIQRRTVADKVRNLRPGFSKVFALVASGDVSKSGDQTIRQAGMITKRSARTRKIEAFTHSPIGTVYTIVTYTDLASSGMTLTSAQALVAKSIIYNTTDGYIYYVDSSSTNSTTTTIKVTAINGGTSLAVGDKVILIGMAYEEGSSAPTVLSKTDDNIYNIMQIFRFPVSIARSAKGSDTFGGDYWSRLKENNLFHGMRLAENAFIMGQRASSTNETTTGAGTAKSFGTMRGLWHWAQNTFDCGGQLTWTKFRKDLPLTMSNILGPTMKILMLCGRQTRGIMQDWIDGRQGNLQPGSYKQFGVESDVFLAGGLKIECVCHDLFDTDGMTNAALVMVPDMLAYYFREGCDFHPKSNIQSPDVDGFEDEIIGEVSNLPECGGYSLTKVTNIF